MVNGQIGKGPNARGRNGKGRHGRGQSGMIPFATLSGHIPKIDGSHSRMQVEVIPNIQILQIGYIVELKRKY